MLNMFDIKKKFPAFFQPAPESFDESRSFDRIFRWFAVCWFLFWSLLPLISLSNEFIDPLENIVWGRHFQLGYDKNPYLGAWLGHGFWLLTGKTLWINSVLSQCFVLLGFCSVYALAKKMLSPAAALIAVLSLAFINFYGMKSVEFCDDVMELGLWPLTLLFFYRALTRGNRFGDWLATGAFLGLSFMTKYYALVIAIPMLAVLLLTAKGRKAWITPAIYAAAVLGFAITLPNLIWLLKNEMVAVDYALGRAGIGGGAVAWTRHLTNPLSALNRALGVVFLPFVFMLALVFPRPAEKRTLSEEERFDRFFLYCFAVGPMGITLLFSLCSGAKINYSWVVPCFPLLPMLVLHHLRPMLNPVRVRCFLGSVIVMALVFGSVFLIRSVWWQAYGKDNCDYENYPGKELSAVLTKIWHDRYHSPLPYVIGDRESTCNLAVYSSDRPEAYFSANPKFSQWIDEEDIRKRGAILLWEADEEEEEDGKPHFLKRFAGPEWNVTPPMKVQVPRAAPLWFRRLTGREPAAFTAVYYFIEPADGSAETR